MNFKTKIFKILSQYREFFKRINTYDKNIISFEALLRKLIVSFNFSQFVPVSTA